MDLSRRLRLAKRLHGSEILDLAGFNYHDSTRPPSNLNPPLEVEKEAFDATLELLPEQEKHDLLSWLEIMADKVAGNFSDSTVSGISESGLLNELYDLWDCTQSHFYSVLGKYSYEIDEIRDIPILDGIPRDTDFQRKFKLKDGRPTDIYHPEKWIRKAILDYFPKNNVPFFELDYISIGSEDEEVARKLTQREDIPRESILLERILNSFTLSLPKDASVNVVEKHRYKISGQIIECQYTSKLFPLEKPISGYAESGYIIKCVESPVVFGGKS